MLSLLAQAVYFSASQIIYGEGSVFKVPNHLGADAENKKEIQ